MSRLNNKGLKKLRKKLYEHVSKNVERFSINKTIDCRK